MPGNYHITLLTHISGKYELISGQRSWGRLNWDSVPNSGSNCSSIVIDGNEVKLTGLNSIAADEEKTKEYLAAVGRNMIIVAAAQI